MNKNSTLKLWSYLIKKEYSSFDKEAHRLLSENKIGPKKETLDIILAYSRSVQGIRTKLRKDKVLISLN